MPSDDSSTFNQERWIERNPMSVMCDFSFVPSTPSHKIPAGHENDVYYFYNSSCSCRRCCEITEHGNIPESPYDWHADPSWYNRHYYFHRYLPDPKHVSLNKLNRWSTHERPGRELGPFTLLTPDGSASTPFNVVSTRPSGVIGLRFQSPTFSVLTVAGDSLLIVFGLVICFVP